MLKRFKTNVVWNVNSEGTKIDPDRLQQILGFSSIPQVPLV